MNGIILLSFVFLSCSFLLGIIIKKAIKLGDSVLLSTPLGSICLIGILQIVYYPIQIFELRVNYLVYLTIFIVASIYLYSIIKYKVIIEEINS